MKISSELLTILEKTMSVYNTDENRNLYKNGKFPRADKTKDVNCRFRWDIFYAAQRSAETDLWKMIREESLNDDHLYTAFKKIIPPLN